MVDGVIEDVVDLDPDLGAGVGSNFNLLLGGLSRALKVFLPRKFPNFNLSLRLNLLFFSAVFALGDFSDLLSAFFAALDFGGDLMI